MQKIITLLVALLYCVAASAAWVNKSGQSLPETSDRKANGEFVAQLVFVADEHELFKSWAVPSESVNIKDIESIQINSPISAFIVFGGCQPDTKGNCNVSMRFQVLSPDGKTYSETPPMEVWSNKPLPPNKSLQLSVDYLKVVIEPHELRGQYVVNTEVRDNNSGKSIRLQKNFRALEQGAK